MEIENVVLKDGLKAWEGTKEEISGQTINQL
jgi:hypothetical protein